MNVCLENFGPYWTSASDQSAAEGLINLKKKNPALSSSALWYLFHLAVGVSSEDA